MCVGLSVREEACRGLVFLDLKSPLGSAGARGAGVGLEVFRERP